MRTFVMGDVHGADRALKQCLERSGFDYEKDRLIQLGDVADSFEGVFACVEELLKIKNIVAIRGNHDDWFLEFIHTGLHPQDWKHGGKGTLMSYLRHAGKERLIKKSRFGFKTGLDPADIPAAHQSFFRDQLLYHVDDGNRCFVHAGFDRKKAFEGQRRELYFWDRDLWHAAQNWKIGHEELNNPEPFHMVTEFTEIYLGHTSTVLSGTDKPMKAAHVHNLDTGAGRRGRLTIMDVDTKQYWQSDPVNTLQRARPFHRNLA